MFKICQKIQNFVLSILNADEIQLFAFFKTDSLLESHRVHLWWIHVDVWQNQYSIIKLKKKKKKERKKVTVLSLCSPHILPPF